MTPSGAPEVALTLVIPLRAKAGMSLPDFYQYWLNAHVTLPPRFPGISSIWLHVVSFDRQLWPRLPGVSPRPEPEDEFHGVREATFPTMSDLELFQSYAHVQMVDGINFLGEVITYSSLGSNSRRVGEKLGPPTPDGHDGLVRHLLFLRRRADVSAADLRRFVSHTLEPAYARLSGGPEAAAAPVRAAGGHPGPPWGGPVQATGASVPGRLGGGGGRRGRPGQVRGLAGVDRHRRRPGRPLRSGPRRPESIAASPPRTGERSPWPEYAAWPSPTSSGGSGPTASATPRSRPCSFRSWPSRRRASAAPPPHRAYPDRRRPRRRGRRLHRPHRRRHAGRGGRATVAATARVRPRRDGHRELASDHPGGRRPPPRDRTPSARLREGGDRRATHLRPDGLDRPRPSPARHARDRYRRHHRQLDGRRDRAVHRGGPATGSAAPGADGLDGGCDGPPRRAGRRVGLHPRSGADAPGPRVVRPQPRPHHRRLRRAALPGEHRPARAGLVGGDVPSAAATLG